MGPFGRNAYKGGNARNVPVYDVNPCKSYTFHEGSYLWKSSQKLTFINNLGKIRRK